VVYVSLDLRVNVSGEVISMSMIASLIAPVTSLLDKWIPDADVKQQIAHELATMSERHAQELAVAQIKLNTAEAQGNWFQSGWRPATGWVCVCGFGVNFLVSPIISRVWNRHSPSGYLCYDACPHGSLRSGGNAIL
jgi:hypothetical protein